MSPTTNVLPSKPVPTPLLVSKGAEETLDAKNLHDQNAEMSIEHSSPPFIPEDKDIKGVPASPVVVDKSEQ